MTTQGDLSRRLSASDEAREVQLSGWMKALLPLFDHLKTHPDFASVQHLMDCATDGTVIMMIYFHGYDRLAAGDRFEGESSQLVSQWVADDRRTHRGAWAVASMMATHVCAYLESFLASVASDWCSDADVERVVRAWRVPSTSPEHARSVVRKRVRPSARQDGAQWIRSIEDVFRAVLPDAVKSSLVELIECRNRMAHEFSVPLPYAGPTGTTIKCWLIATQVLGFATLAARCEREPGHG